MFLWFVDKIIISMPLKLKFVDRYFSGHTENPDGSPQFKAGKTKVGDAVDGAIKIVTVAVCVMINTILPEHVDAIEDVYPYLYLYFRL